MKHIRFFLLLLSCMLMPAWMYAQAVVDSLPVVEVSALSPHDHTTSSVTVQQLDKKQLDAMSALSVADAVRFFSGVLVKDYGGLGGLKTISVRSLGTHHTAVMYDGMVWNDAQNGQTDLGKLSLQQMDRITLYQQHPDRVLMPARALAAASVLMMQSSATARPEPQRSASLRMKTGSFGLFNPSAVVTLSDQKRIHQLSGEWLHAHGAYRFPSIEQEGTKDKRQNTDVENARIEYDFTYYPKDSNKLHFKTYYYASNRALPGAVIVNNTSADDHLKDKHFMIQGSWKKHVHSSRSFWINARYNHLFSGYTDPTFNNPQGKLLNRFHQNEYYVSAAVSQVIRTRYELGWASDYFINTLNRTDEFAFNFQPVQRATWLNAFTARYHHRLFHVHAGAVHTYQTDKEKNASTRQQRTALKPFAGLHIQPAVQIPLHIRVSYKETFRAPSFNDLYYTLIGNTALKPEEVKQLNVGVTYRHTRKSALREAVFSVDAYENRVANKIQAVPRQNLFQWSMMNIGKVTVRGVDVSADIQVVPKEKWRLVANATYTLQQAHDITNPGTSGYKQQLPYTPMHSGNAGLTIHHTQWTVAYQMLFSGYRYRQGDPIPENYLDGWMNQDIKISFGFRLKGKMQCRVYAEVNNIGDVHYEIIRYYPMPGAHYRLGIDVNIVQYKNHHKIKSNK
ncbi:MAG: TonB-dependent receptor [Ferruginibacter sp.]|nr:TonB-dependent receptor [Ferruginibacter sp.]